MKTHALLTIGFVLSFITTQSQIIDYNITFSGTGASNDVESVFVQNLTQCTQIIIDGSATLHLSGSNIIDVSEVENSLKIFPNPVSDQCRLQYQTHLSGMVRIELLDISGKMVLSEQNYQFAGQHEIILSGIGSGSFLIRIITESETLNGKILGISNEFPTPRICISELHEVSSFKSTKSKEIIEMDYVEGDVLLFKGISGNYSNIVTHVATENSVITFNFEDATDGDNNHYTTVIIGEQIWMAENLRTTTFIDGTPIPKIEDPTEWAQSTGPAFCWQLNDSAIYAESYGALYNWFTVDNTEKDAMNICPLGWHVSTEADWVTLGEFLGGNLIAGGKLKTYCGNFWDEPNAGATNESGASIKAAGLRTISGVFGDTMYQAYFWTPKQYLPENARFINVSYISSELNFYDNIFTYGFSVRCVKD